MSEQITTIDTPEIIVTITGGNEVITIVNDSSIQIVSISAEGPQGKGGEGVPAGGVARQKLNKIDGTNFNTNWLSNWYDYAMNVEYNGTETVITSGSVLECTIDSQTIYRFIDSTSNANGYPIEDSFYTDFDGTNLTNLIVTRG